MRFKIKNLNAYFNYTKDLGKFKIDATAGYNYQLFQEKDTNQEKLDNPTNEDIATDPDINLQSYWTYKFRV
jgi:iron complex outermembrane receptor protein